MMAIIAWVCVFHLAGPPGTGGEVDQGKNFFAFQFCHHIHCLNLALPVGVGGQC